MTQREKNDVLHRARVHMNTAKASLHGGKIAWKKFRR